MSRRHRVPVTQTHPTFQTLLERHNSGLNIRQEFDRRRQSVPKLSDGEQEVFTILCNLYPEGE